MRQRARTDLCGGRSVMVVPYRDTAGSPPAVPTAEGRPAARSDASSHSSGSQAGRSRTQLLVNLPAARMKRACGLACHAG